MQEAIYTRKIQPYIYNTCDGHRVFAMTPQVGQRSCAIIVQADLSNNILENSFQQHGRACKLDFFLGNKYYRFICAHLWAKTGTAQYSNSLSDIEFLLNLHGPSNIEPVIGADVQDKIGFYNADNFPESVGQYADGPRAAKGKLAFKFFIEKLGLYALNTLSPQENSNYTHWDVHDPNVENSAIFPPRQIDFIFGSKNLAAVSKAMAVNSDATDTDHRAIVCKIPYPMTAEARALKKARAKRRVYEKPRPLNWQLVDPMFNFSI